MQNTHSAVCGPGSMRACGADSFKEISNQKEERKKQQMKAARERGSKNKDKKIKKRTREMYCSIPLGNRVIFCIV